TYFSFCLPGQFRIPVLFDEPIGNVESAEGFNLPLRRAVPDRVRPPNHMVLPKRLENLTQPMRADFRIGADELSEGIADLHIDILDSGFLLLHPAEFGGPRNASRLLKLLVRRIRVFQRGMVDKET